MIYIYTQYVGYHELYPKELIFWKCSTIELGCRAFNCRENIAEQRIKGGFMLNTFSMLNTMLKMALRNPLP